MADEQTSTPASPTPEQAAPPPSSPAPDQGGDAPEFPPQSEPTSRSAIERAFSKVDMREVTVPGNETIQSPPAETPPESQPEERPRDEHGRFVARGEQAGTPAPGEEGAARQGEQAQPTDQFAAPPDRFSPDAKAEWAKAPLPVRAEVSRAITELSQGLEQYRTEAQAYQPYKVLDQHLRQTGQKFEDVMQRYTGIENMLRSDPLRGLDTICHNMGTTLHEIAAHVLGVEPDQQVAQLAQANNQLQAQLQQLAYRLQTQQAEAQTSAEQQTLDAVTSFANAKDANGQLLRPDFDDLADDIAWFISTGRTKDLQKAYDLARGSNPRQGQPPATAGQTAQTRKGQLSVNGAPGSGSYPDKGKPSSSSREALKKSFAAVGLT